MGAVSMLVLGGAILLYGLLSERAERSLISPPMAFTALGFLAGPPILGLLDFHIDEHVVHSLAEITLAVVLFADASRIDARALRAEHALPQRMLMPGLLLALGLGTVTAMLVFPGLELARAALLAAVLAPTDAALGQAVVADERVPLRIRRGISVESGLNDGIALPMVLILISIACAATEEGAALGVTFWVLFTLGQVVLGPLVGWIFGAGFGRLYRLASSRGWSQPVFRSLSAFGLALAAYACAELVHGNGFLAAFVAGLAFGNATRGDEDAEPFLEAEGTLLTLLVFAIFGGALLPEALEHLSWPMVIYALLSLVVVRIGAIAISLIGKRLAWPTVLFLGWFGPRGIASILFALVVISQSQFGVHDEILPVVMITVALSVVLHGVSARPLAGAYAAWVSRNGEADAKGQ